LLHVASWHVLSYGKIVLVAMGWLSLLYFVVIAQFAFHPQAPGEKREPSRAVNDGAASLIVSVLGPAIIEQHLESINEGRRFHGRKLDADWLPGFHRHPRPPSVHQAGSCLRLEVDASGGPALDLLNAVESIGVNVFPGIFREGPVGIFHRIRQV